MIDYQIFLKWAEKTFENVKTSGNEIKINSIFADDNKNHLWCNPSKNAYHCWKTDRSGNLFELVSIVDKVNYQEAVDLLKSNIELKMLEEKVKKFYKDKIEIIKPKNLKINLPDNTYLISNLDKTNKYRIVSENYLAKRNLSIKGLYFCVAKGNSKKDYSNRIIIPYYDFNGSLVYFNSRSLDKSTTLRYMGPDKDEYNVGKSDVLWVSNWGANKLYLTEGEFDAMSLIMCGFDSSACGGKELYDKQLDFLYGYGTEQVRKYKICVAFDRDKSGLAALNKVGNYLLANGKETTYVFPPKKYKDWNEMLISEGANVVKAWIISNEEIFNQYTSIKLCGG